MVVPYVLLDSLYYIWLVVVAVDDFIYLHYTRVSYDRLYVLEF
jgi:hypothetical protein